LGCGLALGCADAAGAGACAEEKQDVQRGQGPGLAAEKLNGAATKPRWSRMCSRKPAVRQERPGEVLSRAAVGQLLDDRARHHRRLARAPSARELTKSPHGALDVVLSELAGLLERADDHDLAAAGTPVPVFMEFSAPLPRRRSSAGTAAMTASASSADLRCGRHHEAARRHPSPQGGPAGPRQPDSCPGLPLHRPLRPATPPRRQTFSLSI
jgi:hypothetical protein